MLIFSGILSFALVMLVYYSHKYEVSPTTKFFLFVVVGLILGLLFSMPTLAIHATLVFLGALIWKIGNWRSSSFLVYMILSAIGPYGYFTYLAVADFAEHQRLIDQYPFESMESRAPSPKKTLSGKASKETESHLKDLEEKLSQGGENDSRSWMLQELHQESVQSFINSPGFGQTRRTRPAEGDLTNLERDESPVLQPGPLPSSTFSEGDLSTEPSDVQPDSLRKMHLSSVFDFANPRGFGWIVDRQKVAGFRAHRFGMVPQAMHWKVQAVELVGILMYERPVVYMSDELPRMDKLLKAPTRVLNTFELRGLEKLHQGDDMFIREIGERLYMLGAVRSVEQCIKCHSGERGDLLGAFSYSLTPTLEK
jgi:hypothetical protein